MKQFRWLLMAVLCISLFSIIAISCQKDVGEGANIPSGQSKLSIFLTDGPYDYQKVLIDIQGILVKVDTCSSHHDEDEDDDHHQGGNHDEDDDHHDSEGHCEVWDTLNIRTGVYDLLTLRNGVDTLLASGFIPGGEVKKIKFVLGTNNSVVIDSVTHPLNLRDNFNFVFVKIRHHQDIDSLTNNNFQFYLDFDVARSIRFDNGKYWLKPVIKPFCGKNFGEIEGKVRPVHSYGLISAINGTDTAYARPDEKEGEFKIRGLKEGTYSVFIDGINGYADTTIDNVVVRRGKEVKIGTVLLRK